MALLLSACASDVPQPTTVDQAGPAAPQAVSSAAPLPSAPAATTAAPPTAPGAGSAPEVGPGSARPAMPTIELGALQRVVSQPVVSLGLDTQKGRVAALAVGGEQTFMDRGEGWQPMPIPTGLRPAAGERDEARIYFGRDNQPRIMGTRLTPAGPEQLYLRYHRGAWKRWPRELASFAGKPRAALYGVLGWDDPEVVCKVGAFCLIKQRKGWSQVPLPVPPPATAVRVDLGADGAYALLDRRLLRLGESSWQAMAGAGPWQSRPAAAWIRGGRGWVSVPAEDSLYRLDGTTWQRHAAPVRGPRGIWSSSVGTLWVVGQDGAAHYAGGRWSRVKALEGPLAEVVGHQGHIWFAGESGVWHARLPP
ncbi:MAG: hypothetical protein JRI68_20635 [Deltaproteobacteria bacterium]|nr:hypothetical protein [Deltaproteobacteria bacterium]